MLFNPAGGILLIRNSYGDSEQFVLPGGGVRPWEAPERAAAREVREELGLTPVSLTHVATHFSGAEGKRDTIHLLRAETDGPPVADNMEVAEARFFAFHALPEKISAATRRRIAEHLGERQPDGSW
jgi:ADP-ribose pyrophosphatase YjhB (NUDIX family)